VAMASRSTARRAYFNCIAVTHGEGLGSRIAVAVVGAAYGLGFRV
jgi:hypothetical protein